MNSGIRRTFPSPHAPMTYRTPLGTQHGHRQDFFTTMALIGLCLRPVVATGRMRQRLVVEDSLQWELGVLKPVLSWLGLLEGDICCTLRGLVQNTMDKLAKFVQFDSWSDYSTFLLHKGTSNMSGRFRTSWVMTTYLQGMRRRAWCMVTSAWSSWWIVKVWGKMNECWKSKVGCIFDIDKSFNFKDQVIFLRTAWKKRDPSE